MCAMSQEHEQSRTSHDPRRFATFSSGGRRRRRERTIGHPMLDRLRDLTHGLVMGVDADASLVAQVAVRELLSRRVGFTTITGGHLGSAALRHPLLRELLDDATREDLRRQFIAFGTAYPFRGMPTALQHARARGATRLSFGDQLRGLLDEHPFFRGPLKDFDVGRGDRPYRARIDDRRIVQVTDDDKTVEIHVFHDPKRAKDDLLASLLDDFAMGEVDAWHAAHAAPLHGSAYLRTVGRDEADTRIAKARERGNETRFERVRRAQ